MHWAWSMPLSPAPKLVLMALADEADDQGYCFPGVPHLAAKCSIGERTVQRILRRLARDHYVSIEQRFRKDRARTSNGYRLAVSRPPSNWHRPLDSSVTGPATPVAGGRCQRSHRGGDTGDGVTTTYPCIEPELQPPRGTEEGTSAAADAARGGGELDFPRTVSATQRHALAEQLAGLSQERAQQILDELAARMNQGHVRSPVRYTAALVARLRRGEFRPESGLAIARQRQIERQHAATAQGDTATNDSSVDAAINRLPEAIRASLERIRRRSQSKPN
ncbi:MAG TPA: helix-turn-helix domain-containing protein [Casimicrobiaceae bacterium]